MTTTTTREDEGAAAIPVAPPPPPPPPRARVSTIVTNDVEEAGEPAPEPYSFRYTADTDDGATSVSER